MGISLRRVRVHDGVHPNRKPSIHTIRGPRMNTNGADNDYAFSLQLEYHGQRRSIAIPLSQEAFSRLALEAAIRNINFGELLAEILTTATSRNGEKQ